MISQMTSPEHLYAEHPQDVLRQWLAWQQSGPVALVVVVDTVGGSVRAPGALMAVTADGRKCGYVSGGCVDADVVLHARRSLESGEVVRLRYGAGSPFIDMPLPCGGTIDIAIIPDVPPGILRHTHDDLAARRSSQLHLAALPCSFSYNPKLRIRISGRGADALALARLVVSSGYELVLQLRDESDIEEAANSGIDNTVPISSLNHLPMNSDDPWTAFVLMFHDPDWELALLQQALSGDAFYIGAVGSRRTQERRQKSLRSIGIPETEVARVKGPIGLVPSMRNASMLAISVLSEIIDRFRLANIQPMENTALLLLAAGASKRFGAGDKLLADLDGMPVLNHAANILSSEHVAARIAVIGPNQEDRRSLLEAAGWTVITNQLANTGQASSLKTGIKAVEEIPQADKALVLLADMPRITDAHTKALVAEMKPGTPAVMSLAGNVPCPPALISKEVFPLLKESSGDTGAGRVLSSLPGTRRVPLPADEAIDIDTPADLAGAGNKKSELDTYSHSR